MMGPKPAQERFSIITGGLRLGEYDRVAGASKPCKSPHEVADGNALAI
jgi:hypothetical protein